MFLITTSPSLSSFFFFIFETALGDFFGTQTEADLFLVGVSFGAYLVGVVFGEGTGEAVMGAKMFEVESCKG